MTGWAPRGERCYAQKSANRETRYNIIASLIKKKLRAFFLFEGYSNLRVYKIYIERVLVPDLEPKMFLIIDNARFHKSKKIIDLIESAGCKVIFLPPYSPDLNPIEHHWAAVKNSIRKTAEKANDFYEAAVQALSKMCAS